MENQGHSRREKFAVPPGLFIIEEGWEQSRPFLCVELNFLVQGAVPTNERMIMVTTPIPTMTSAFKSVGSEVKPMVREQLSAISAHGPVVSASQLHLSELRIDRTVDAEIKIQTGTRNSRHNSFHHSFLVLRIWL